MRIFAALLLFALSGCAGWQPVYAERDDSITTTSHSEYAEQLSKIELETTENAQGEQFKNKLTDLLNPTSRNAGSNIYRLNVEFSLQEIPIGIEKDGTISRYNLQFVSYYKLYRITDNALVDQGKLRRVASYSLLPNAYFSSYVSRADAIKRCLDELAEDYRQKLIAFVAQNRDPSLLAVQKENPRLKEVVLSPTWIDPSKQLDTFDEIQRKIAP